MGYKYQDVITYYDELNDDFGNTINQVKPLPKRYKIYSKNPFTVLFNFVIYWIIVRPIAIGYMKLRFHYKVKNKKAFKEARKSGYFVFTNHTMIVGDAFGANMMDYRKRNYIITGAEVSSLTKILYLLRGIGSLPITTELGRNKELVEALRYIILKKKKVVTIYPEAHIWPYYTKIRDYRSEAFKYAVNMNVPIYVVTNCYTKKRHGKRPKVTAYVNGPFYPDKELGKREATQKLRDIAHKTMKNTASKYSNYEYFNYINGNEGN